MGLATAGVRLPLRGRRRHRCRESRRRVHLVVGVVELGADAADLGAEGVAMISLSQSPWMTSRSLLRRPIRGARQRVRRRNY